MGPHRVCEANIARRSTVTLAELSRLVAKRKALTLSSAHIMTLSSKHVEAERAGGATDHHQALCWAVPFASPQKLTKPKK